VPCYLFSFDFTVNNETSNITVAVLGLSKPFSAVERQVFALSPSLKNGKWFGCKLSISVEEFSEGRLIVARGMARQQVLDMRIESGDPPETFDKLLEHSIEHAGWWEHTKDPEQLWHQSKVVMRYSEWSEKHQTFLQKIRALDEARSLAQLLERKDTSGKAYRSQFQSHSRLGFLTSR
jgi:hypothetical protein